MPKTYKKVAWSNRNANIIRNLSNSDSICCHVVSGRWCAQATSTNFVIDVFLAFFEPVILQLNLCSVKSKLAIRHCQQMKRSWTIDLLFSNTKLIKKKCEYLNLWNFKITVLFYCKFVPLKCHNLIHCLGL